MKKSLLFFIVLFVGYFIAKTIQNKWKQPVVSNEKSLFDTIPPRLELKKENFNVLLYSKANGWVHEDAIAAAKEVFGELAQQQAWTLSRSDRGSVFNPEQLSYFDVVVWNNVTGPTLNETQRKAFKNYIENGGGFVGIHGAGDDSHQWKWYDEKVIRTHFSHHPMQPQFQLGTLKKNCEPLFPACADLPQEWTWEEEWYVFYESPRDNGSNVLYNLEESNLVMEGEQEDKKWGMGKDHPIVWYHLQEKGRIFYTAMGHKGTYYQDPDYQKLLIEAVEWAGNINLSNIK